MGRLADKLNKASDALAHLETSTEKSVDAFIARVDKAHERKEAVFLKKHQALDGHMTDLAEFEKDLTEFDGKNDRSDVGESTETKEPPASWVPKA